MSGRRIREDELLARWLIRLAVVCVVVGVIAAVCDLSSQVVGNAEPPRVTLPETVVTCDTDLAALGAIDKIGAQFAPEADPLPGVRCKRVGDGLARECCWERSGRDWWVKLECW